MKRHCADMVPDSRQMQDVEHIDEVLADVDQSADLGGILEHLLKRALGFIKVDQGGIYLLDERSGLLKVAAYSNLPAKFIDQIDCLRLGEGFSGQVAQSGDPLVIPDIANDPRFSRIAVTVNGLHSLAVVPIWFKGKILGTLFAITDGYREFQSLEVELLTSVGSQIGVTIENARLLADTQNRLAQLTALQETSRAVVSTLDLNALLNLIVQQATALLRAEGGLLNLANQDRLEDEVVASTGTTVSALGIKLPLTQTLSGWVALHNQPVIVNDISNDPRTYYHSRAERSSKRMINAAVAPLTIKDRVIGTLAVVDKMGGAVDFVQPDLDLLVGFASQAAAAIENARLYAAEQRRSEQFRVITEISRRLTLILDLDELLEQVVTLIQQTFGYYHVAIGLIEGDEVVYQYGAGELWQQPGFHLVPSRLRIGLEGLSGWVAVHGTPLNVTDVSRDPRYVAIEGSQARSELIVPIIAREQMIGTLDALSDRLSGFDETDLLVMQSLAHQVGAAIENARLFQAEKRRTEQFRLIAEIGRRLTQVLDLDELLKQIVTLIHQALGYYHIDIGLIEGDEVVYQYGAGAVWNQSGFHLVPSHLKVGREGLGGKVAATGIPAYVPDVTKDPGYVAIEGIHGRSELVIPILAKEQVIGVLNALSDQLNGFDDTDLLVMQSLAHQVGVAIENARLFQAEKRRAEQEERSRLARELHDAVTQTLFSASLIAEAVPPIWDKDPQQGRELLQELRHLSRGALAEMRTLLLELRPSAVVETRLEELLRQLGEAASGREGIPVNVWIEGQGTLPPEVHIALYRIAQEALNNVVKHARASQTTVRLCYSCGEPEEGRRRHGVLLSIIDNGRGFDLEQAPHHRLGLGIMQERADSIGASLFIDSQPGEGTHIRVLWKKTETGRDE